MTYDPDFKEIFEEIVHDDVGTKIIKSVKVGTLPLEIDAILEFNREADFKYLRPLDIVRKHSGANRFVIEYKGPTDSLSKNNLRKLIAYRELYLIEKDLHEKMQTTPLVISTKLPRKLLDEMEAQDLAKGVHQLVLSGQSIFIISINALEVLIENYGLLVFSSSKKQMEKFVGDIIDQNYSFFKNKRPHQGNTEEERFLSYVIKLDFETVHRVAKTRGLNMSIVLDNIMKAINHFGLKTVIDEVGLRTVIDEVGYEKVAEELGVEYLLKALRKTIHNEETLEIFEQLVKKIYEEDN